MTTCNTLEIKNQQKPEKSIPAQNMIFKICSAREQEIILFFSQLKTLKVNKHIYLNHFLWKPSF